MEPSGPDALFSGAHRYPPQHINDARSALSGSRDPVRCGRPTKRGTTCGLLRAKFTPACPTHATADETAVAAAEVARLTALVNAWTSSLTPKCHDWPVTDDDRRAVAELPVGTESELHTARLVHDLLYRWQQGRCAVCGGTKQSDDLVLDHDHTTALVRGWLCRSCNTSEPHSDDGDFAKYRACPPAVMLGVSARYEHPWYGLVEPEMTNAEWLARTLASTPSATPTPAPPRATTVPTSTPASTRRTR